MKPYSDAEYKFLYDAYTGLGGFADGSYIIKHPRESDEKYNIRKKLSYYPNFVKQITDVYISHIFKDPPFRDAKGITEISEFWKDATKKAEHIDYAMKRFMRLAMIYGAVFLIVDRLPVEMRTKADDKENLPYLAARLPMQVYDYSINSFGELEWIVFKEVLKDKQFGQQEKIENLYRYFDRNNWILLKGISISSASLIARGQHNLGVVPVVGLYANDIVSEDTIFGTSFIYEIAKINHRIFNALSELDEILRNQTFSILTLPASSPADEDKYRNLVLSSENAILYDPANGGQPSFIAPPNTPAEAYEKRIQELVSYIYKITGLDFTGGVSQSGVALAFMFQETNRMLSGLVRNIEVAEYKILDIVGRWLDIDVSHVSVEYKKNFSVVDIQQEIRNAIDLLSMDISKRFNIELKKKIAGQILGDVLDTDELQVIYDEIEMKEDYMLENRLRQEGLSEI